jgi:hypothetical protein
VTRRTDGIVLSEDVNRNAWSDYINQADYPEADAVKLVDALMAAQKEEFEKRLPAGGTWSPGLSEAYWPDESDNDEFDLADAMREACDAVTARYEEIERETLGA